MKAGHGRRIGAFCGLVGLLLILFAGAFAPPAAAAPKVGNECSGAFQGDAPGSLELDVTWDGLVGTFTATWDTDDWQAEAPEGLLDKILLCFEVDGAIVDSLTAEEKPTKNDGEFVVEVDFEGVEAVENEEVCAAARLSGTPSAGNPSTTKSDIVCFDIGEPGEEPTTELTVSKTVNGDAGSDTFSFTVDCAPVELAAENTDGSGVTIDVNGVASFTLANGQSETISGLPEAATCDVTETINGTLTWTTTINGTASSTRIADDVAATEEGTAVAFVNSRVYTYQCESATDVTSGSATMRGSTDDPSVTGASFLLTGRDPIAGALASGKANAQATGLVKDTNYTYKVAFSSATGGVGTSADCAFRTLDEVVVQAAVVTPPPPPAPAAVLGVQETRPAAVLATTGVSPILAAAGIGLVALGLMLVFSTRRPEGRHFTG